MTAGVCFLQAPNIRQSVAEALRERAASTPTIPWLRWKDRSGAVQTLTYEQGRAQVELIARGLMATDLKVQDRVGIFSPNRPEWMIADLAAVHAGAITVPVY